MKPYIGWIITGSLVFYLIHLVFPPMTFLQAIFSWLVPVLLWDGLGRGIRNQALILIGGGLGAHIFSACHGKALPWPQLFTLNLPLLAMFVAVSFLSLTNTQMERDILPRGKKAVLQTALGTHILASVINMSVLFVFGDRLQKNGSLNKSQQIILARSFCAAAWWSPFFIATGVAMTYAPNMSWHKTLIPGILMSLLAITYSVVEVCYFRKEAFSGYPFKKESMQVPVFLAVLVVVVHWLRPEASILNIICILSPAGAIGLMTHRPRREMLKSFINTRLISMGSQFTLFLGAGVFSTGIKSFIHVYPGLFSLGSSAFTPALFSLILGLVILVGVMGVHPVVSISIISPLLLPLNMDHSQLGFLFLSAWAISTGSSPLSGVGLALVSRYRASTGGILRCNWHYAVMMWAFVSMINLVFFVR